MHPDSPSGSRSSEIALIPARGAHAEFWHQIRNEPKSLAFNPVDSLSVSQLRARLGRCQSDFMNVAGHEYRWMIVDRAGQRDESLLLGTVSATANWRMRHAEIGYQVAEAHHGRGVAKQALRLLLERAFAEGTRLMRVFATIHEANAASIRVVEGLGFTREGTLRDHYQIQGQMVTEKVYGLLRREWVEGMG